MSIIKHAWVKAEEPHVAHVEVVPDMEAWMKGNVYDKEMKGIKKARFFWIQKYVRRPCRCSCGTYHILNFPALLHVLRRRADGVVAFWYKPDSTHASWYPSVMDDDHNPVKENYLLEGIERERYKMCPSGIESTRYSRRNFQPLAHGARCYLLPAVVRVCSPVFQKANGPGDCVPPLAEFPAPTNIKKVLTESQVTASAAESIAKSKVMKWEVVPDVVMMCSACIENENLVEALTRMLELRQINPFVAMTFEVRPHSLLPLLPPPPSPPRTHLKRAFLHTRALYVLAQHTHKI